MDTTAAVEETATATTAVATTTEATTAVATTAVATAADATTAAVATAAVAATAVATADATTAVPTTACGTVTSFVAPSFRQRPVRPRLTIQNNLQQTIVSYRIAANGQVPVERERVTAGREAYLTDDTAGLWLFTDVHDRVLTINGGACYLVMENSSFFDALVH